MKTLSKKWLPSVLAQSLVLPPTRRPSGRCDRWRLVLNQVRGIDTSNLLRNVVASLFNVNDQPISDAVNVEGADLRVRQPHVGQWSMVDVATVQTVILVG